MLQFLLVKEFKQLWRNPFLPGMLLLFPPLVLLIFPWAANFEIRNINLGVVDNNHTSYSQRLVQKVVSSGYFLLTDVSSGYEEALEGIESDRADIILVIPPHFERDLVRDQAARVQISANAVNAIKAGIGSFYLSAIVSDFASEIRREAGGVQATMAPVVELVPRYRFNQNLSYIIFMVPALMVMALTMVCGFLPAMNIVGEKEAGTMEQMNVSPVSKFTFVLSKLLPYWMIGILVLTLLFVVAWAVYSLIPLGSLSTIYLFAVIYIVVISGLGLIISNHSQTQQQAMFVMYFIVILLILMSGLFTPVESMPDWAQAISVFNPLKYFIEVMRLVYLKGSSLADLRTELMTLCGFATFFNVWAVLSYRKRD